MLAPRPDRLAGIGHGKTTKQLTCNGQLPQLCSWAARRRPHDPDATQISDAVVRQAVCRLAANALLAPPGPDAHEQTAIEAAVTRVPS
jgi:hypothetical protein